MSEPKMEMIAAPIPTEVPSPPNLDQLPMDILHSATVEMLIQQNEDLSSRLKVNIRRNSLLEQRILSLEKQTQQLERQKENLTAQNQIIKEKEKIWLEKKQDKDRRLQGLQQEAELLERRYIELQTTTQYKFKESLEHLEKHKTEIAKLRKKLDLAHKVKERGKERLRDFLIATANGMNQEQSVWKQHQSQQRRLEKEHKRLQDKLAEKEVHFKEQLQKLKEASLFSLRDLKSQLQQSQELSAQRQVQIDDLRQEKNQLESGLLEEKKWRAKASQLSQHLAQLKNELIEERRHHRDEREADAELISQLKLELREQKRKSADLDHRLQTQSDQLSQCENQILDIAKDNNELAEQAEHLQKLWAQAQERLEKESARAKALAKINRELSQQSKNQQQQRAIHQARGGTIHAATTSCDQQEDKGAEVKRPSRTAAPSTPIQDKINQVYASQYKALGRPPNMDV